MKTYQTQNIRNVVLLGSTKSGKTTLSEAMLYEGKVIDRRGTVEAKNTVSDNAEIEQINQRSIYATPLYAEFMDTKFNIIDTPGADDFVGGAVSAFKVCDTGVLVVNAQQGVEVAEIVGMGLHFDTEAFLLDDGKELFHGAEPHAVADLLLVGIAGELGVDDRNAHVDGDLDDLLPVGDRVLTLLLGGAGPAVNNDEGRNLDARVLQSLAVLRLTLFGEQGVFVEGIDPGVGGLLNVFVAPVRYLVDHILDAHLFCENVYIKSNFHTIYLLN